MLSSFWNWKCHRYIVFHLLINGVTIMSTPIRKSWKQSHKSTETKSIPLTEVVLLDKQIYVRHFTDFCRICLLSLFSLKIHIPLASFRSIRMFLFVCRPNFFPKHEKLILNLFHPDTSFYWEVPRHYTNHIIWQSILCVFMTFRWRKVFVCHFQVQTLSHICKCKYMDGFHPLVNKEIPKNAIYVLFWHRWSK